MQLSLAEQLMGLAFIVGLIGILVLYHVVFDRRKKAPTAAPPPTVPAPPIAAASPTPDPGPVNR